MIYKIICGIDGLNQVVEYLHTILIGSDCIVLLRGDLASGKTTLVANFVQSLGEDQLVTSPTFSLQRSYGDRLFHYDLYNKTLEEFIALGMLEELEKEGIHFVEWGSETLEEILKEYQFSYITVTIEKKEKQREYTIET